MLLLNRLTPLAALLDDFGVGKLLLRFWLLFLKLLTASHLVNFNQT